MLYHKNIYWNQDFNRQCMEILRTSHFEDSEHLRENKHNLNLRAVMAILQRLRRKEKHALFFEADVSNNIVHKFALRTSYDKYHDIIIVIGRNGVIITAWVNKKTNNHTNININRYVH